MSIFTALLEREDTVPMFTYPYKAGCLFNTAHHFCVFLVAQREEEKHPNDIMIWCSFDSFEHRQPTWF